LLLAATAVMAGRAVRAQQKVMPVIGALGIGSPPANLGDLLRGSIHQGMSEEGFVEGQNMMWSIAGPIFTMIDCPRSPPTSSAARST
jgi:hypothetical protein